MERGPRTALPRTANLQDALPQDRSPPGPPSAGPPSAPFWLKPGSSDLGICKVFSVLCVLLLLVSRCISCHAQNGKPSIRQMGGSRLSEVAVLRRSSGHVSRSKSQGVEGRKVCEGALAERCTRLPNFRTRSALSKQRLQLSVPRTSQ